MKKMLSIFCAVLFMLGIAANIHYAVEGYGMKKNNLNLVILAENTSTTPGGTGLTVCYISSTQSKNTGTCKKAVDGTGDVCTVSGFMDKKNCYGHGAGPQPPEPPGN